MRTERENVNGCMRMLRKRATVRRILAPAVVACIAHRLLSSNRPAPGCGLLCMVVNYFAHEYHALRWAVNYRML